MIEWLSYTKRNRRDCMNRQQLECFVCVADRLNFTKAAEELYLTTPTVTHHIQNLEAELDTMLFIRTSRMVKLTEAGNMFYRDAKEILTKIDMAQKKLHKIADEKVSFLRIGCSSEAELSTWKDALCELQRRFPNTYPQIEMNDYFKLKHLFENKQLDVMLVSKEMIKELKDCSFHKIKEMKSYAVISDTAKSSYKDCFSFAELKKECLITLHPKFIPFQYGNALQEKIMFHAQTHFHITCEHDQAAMLLARCGYGIAILPEFCIDQRQEGISILPILEDSHSIDYGIAYHKHTKSEVVRYLIQHMK